MMKKLLIILLGGLQLLWLASGALAELKFSTPYIPRSDNRYIEVGATATIKVIYKNETGNDVNVDAAKLYLDYISSVIDLASISITNFNLPTFTVSENNTTTQGSIRYQLRTEPSTGQKPLKVLAGASVDLIKITFHVNQGAVVGNESYFMQFTKTDRPNNVQIVQSGGNVTGSIWDPADNHGNTTEIHLEGTKTPNFGGLNTVGDAGNIGNTLDLNWAASETGANDKTTNAETLYGSGTKLRYNVYRNTSPSLGNKVYSALNATTQTDTGLSDCTPYYYMVRGQDDCTVTHNEEQNTIQKTGTPHDYTAPGVPTINSIASGDTKLKINWANPGGDIGGMVLIRKQGGYATPSFTNAAGDADGTTPPDVGKAPPGDSGAVVVYKGMETSFQDSGLSNGIPYYYSVYAYDPAIAGPPRQQGYNWSNPGQKVASPGVAPSALQNFLTLSSSEGLTANWTNPPEDFYGGALVIGTTDLSAWSALTTTSHLDTPDTVKLALNQTAPLPAAPGAPTQAVINNYGGSALDSTGGTIYYFQAFAYNAGAPLDAANKDSIASHQFSNGVMGGARVGGIGGGEVIYNLTKKTDGLGVNSVGMPFDAPMTFTSLDGATSIPSINTLQDLINAIGKTGVVATAYWDNANQQLAGNTYDAAGMATFSTTGYDPAKEILKAGQGYYLSVTKSVSFKLKK